MPVTSTSRKKLSDLVKGEDTFAMDNAVDFNYDTVTVGGGAGAVDNIGIPLIWVNANSRFEVYVAQSIATAITTGGSPLKDGSVICLSVGSAQGKGENYEDTDISSDVSMTVLYRGDAAIVNDGIVWGAAAGGAQTAFLAQLEAQRITTTTVATDAAVTYLA